MGEATTLFVVSTTKETEHQLLCFDGCEAAIEEATVVATSVEKSIVRWPCRAPLSKPKENFGRITIEEEDTTWLPR
ncbi:hypothetical protein BHE74_00005101 [Ensete ventricosum]|nr:hypothetical protein BHE74_00005101 [Ensete ventricosum]RZR80536.1 hypothetical protein BHM03_00006583 [Ensete ventricosum]